MRTRKVQRIEGHIYGQKRSNSRIFKISGNWAYKPTMFYSSSLPNAKATADNIESSLYVWNEAEEKWMIAIDRDCVWEIGSEFDEDGDIALQNINSDLKKAGFDITYEELRKKRGQIIESAIRSGKEKIFQRGPMNLFQVSLFRISILCNLFMEVAYE